MAEKKVNTKFRVAKVESTGFPSLDRILGGGEPRGVVIEHWGEPGCGKTTFRLMQAGDYLSRGEKVIWYDTEHCLPALPEKYLKGLGFAVENENLIYIEPTDGSHEQDLQFIIDTVKQDKIGLVVIDSVAQLDLDADRGMDKAEQAALAKDLKRFLRKMLDSMASKNTTLIIINQITMEMNKMFTRETTPGGHNPKFTTWARLRFGKPHPIDEKGTECSESESAVGFVVKVVVKKTRGGKPHLFTELRFDYDKGFNKTYDRMIALIAEGKIVQSGAWYQLPNKKKVQGQNNVLKYLEKEKEEK